jgi:hypothetical protein
LRTNRVCPLPLKILDGAARQQLDKVLAELELDTPPTAVIAEKPTFANGKAVIQRLK